MTDARIPMGEGREQQARAVLASHLRPVNKGAAWNVLEGTDDAYWSPILEAMLAFADTPPPAAAGDRSLADIRKIVTDALWDFRINNRSLVTRIVQDLKAALRTPEPNSGGEAPDASRPNPKD